MFPAERATSRASEPPLPESSNIGAPKSAVDAGREEEFSLGYVSAVLRRRRWTVLGTIGALMALLVAVFLFLRPVYTAHAKLVIEEPQSVGGMLGQLADLPAGLGSLLGGAGTPTTTEIEFVHSRPVASSVVGERGSSAAAPEEGLNMMVRVDDLDEQVRWRRYARRISGAPTPEGDPGAAVTRWDFPIDFETPLRLHFTGASRVDVRLDRPIMQRAQSVSFTPGEPFDYLEATLVLQPDRDLTGRSFQLTFKKRQKAVDDFLKELTVQETKRGSNVLKLSYSDFDAGRAADVVNGVVRSYVAHNRSRQQRKATRPIEYIEEEIERVHAELERAEEGLLTFAESAGAIVLPEAAIALVEKMAEVDLEKAKLELRVQTSEKLLASIRSGTLSYEEIAGLEPPAFLSSDIVQPLAVLLAKKAVLQEEYTSEWPALEAVEIEIRERVEGIENVISGVIWKDESLAADLDTILARYTAEMERLPETHLTLVRYKRQVEAFTQIYMFLIGRIQEAKISETAAVPNVDVVEWAVPPLIPSSPRMLLVLALGAVLSGVLGLGLGLVREWSVRPVSTDRQAEAVYGTGLLGRVPFARGHSPGRATLDASPLREDFRLLRTSLQRAVEAGGVRSLVVVSARPGEGRSSVSAQLAAALARGGSKTLLVDGDLKRSSLHQWTGAKSAPGLTDVLAGSTHWSEATHSPGIEGLDVLCAGAGGDDSGDWLASPNTGRLLEEWQSNYDLVVIDSPALLEASDASAWTARVDASLVVCAHGKVRESDAQAAATQLGRSGVRVIGLVLNRYSGRA